MASGEAAPFPPPGYAPPVSRTAKSDDGRWTPLGPGAAGGADVLYRSTVHPHPIKGFVYVAIVAIDLRRVEVRLVAGTEEPESDAVPKEKRTGLVPASDQDDLLAVFNGGFKARHGNYGAMIGGDLFVPPRDDACVVVLPKGGGIRIGPWSEHAANRSEMASFRQTPPCLLDRGVPHPLLVAEEKTRKWGAAEGGDVEIRRSAVGLDPSGATLFYGLGEWTTAKTLTDGMKAAGAVSAAELDVNWSYTYFLLFGRPGRGEPRQVTAALVPKTKFVAEGFVTKPSYRDFFYLMRKR